MGLEHLTASEQTKAASEDTLHLEDRSKIPHFYLYGRVLLFLSTKEGLYSTVVESGPLPPFPNVCLEGSLKDSGVCLILPCSW